MFLLTNLVLQGFLLYMLSVEERTLESWLFGGMPIALLCGVWTVTKLELKAKFGGQMHLCDFGAADLAILPSMLAMRNHFQSEASPELHNWSIGTSIASMSSFWCSLHLPGTTVLHAGLADPKALKVTVAQMLQTALVQRGLCIPQSLGRS